HPPSTPSIYTLSYTTLFRSSPNPGDSNSIVIPAGSNSIALAFHTVNDSTVEGPETVTLTLLDDNRNYPAPTYVVVALAEATITIDRKSTRLNSSHVEISYAV